MTTQMTRKVANWTKGLQVQMNTTIFHPYDPISIIPFLSSFKLACDTNGIHEIAAMWLLHFFLEKQAAAVVNSRIALEAM